MRHAANTRLMAMAAAAAAAAAVLGLALGTRWWLQRPLQPDAVLAYKQVAGHTLVLHVFKPPAATATVPTPALLLFHGGAWRQGDASQFHPQCRHFSRQGLTCISAVYRTAQRHHSTPADALHDARDAMRHLRRNAAALGIDARRIAAGGGSAGGQLAAALGVAVPLPDPAADPLAPTRPDALLLLNPMLDLAPGKPDHGLVAGMWRDLSPRQHVGPSMPPTLVMTGSADPEVALATVQDFCAAAQSHGVLCQLLVYDGAGHGFFNPDVDGGHHHRQTLQDMAGFLTRLGWLQPGAP